MAPPSPQQAARPPLPARLLGAGARSARRVADAAGLDETVERTTEEAIVRALESPAVERAIVRVLEGPAAEEALQALLSSPAVERALVQVLDSDLVDRVWGRVLASDEAQRLVERIAEAPEVRGAIASQGVGLVEDVGRQVRRVVAVFDDALERVARRLTGRGPRPEPTERVGLLTRGLAFAIDGVILNGALLGLTALIGVVVSGLFEPEGVSAPTLALGAGAWIVFGSAYLIVFWALAGQTPGMRFLSIRLDAAGQRRIGARRARRRLEGLVLALLPLGLGLRGVVLSDDRRGFHDRFAGTDVVRADPVAAPWSQRAAPTAAPGSPA